MDDGAASGLDGEVEVSVRSPRTVRVSAARPSTRKVMGSGREDAKAGEAAVHGAPADVGPLGQIEVRGTARSSAHGEMSLVESVLGAVKSRPISYGVPRLPDDPAAALERSNEM